MFTFVLSALILVGVTAWVLTAPLSRNPGRTASLLTGVVLITGTAAIYLTIGTPAALNELPVQQDAPLDAEAAAAELERRLSADPNNPENLEGWVLLGRLHAQQRDYSRAAAALDRAWQLDPNNPAIKTELAEALMFSQPDQPPPVRAQRLLQQALANNPDLQKALWLSGVIAASQGDAESARRHWTRLLQQMDPDTAVHASVARQLAALDATDNPEASTPPDDLVRVEVRLAPGLRPRAEAAIFLIVRDPRQGGPPLAVKRIPATRLSGPVGINTADAMLPDTPWLNFAELTVSARLSQNGTVVPGTDYPESAPRSFQPFNDTLLDLQIEPVAP